MRIQQTQLSNGLRILSQNMPHTHSVSLGIWVGAGARHEKDDQHGLAHLLEHMAFKGTDTRSALDIVQQIEAVGGDVNAATSLERTAYYVRVLKDDIKLGIDILSDIVLNPVFLDEELTREKGVILSEIGQHLDTPDDVAFDHMRHIAFPTHSIGRNILGTVQSVENFTSRNLKEFRTQHYNPANMLIAAVGDIDHQELVDSIKGFELAAPSNRQGKEKPLFGGGEKYEERDVEQAHLVLGFEGVSQKDPDYYGAQLLSSLLGGGMSSRLFQNVREKRGLAYSVFSFCWSFSDAGLFGVYAGTNPDDIKDAACVISEELHGVCRNIHEEEIETARAQIKAGLLMGLESSYVRAERMARQFMTFGRALPLEEILQRIDEVDSDSLKALSNRIFSAEKLSVAIVAPKGHALQNHDARKYF